LASFFFSYIAYRDNTVVDAEADRLEGLKRERTEKLALRQSLDDQLARERARLPALRERVREAAGLMHRFSAAMAPFLSPQKLAQLRRSMQQPPAPKSPQVLRLTAVGCSLVD
jgi:hypothetical protein